MMEVGVQVSELGMLREAVKSKCNGIIFGSEFCMFRIPSMDELEEAYSLTCDVEKAFTYTLPRLSDGALEKIRKHFTFLNNVGEVRVVINDLGALKILKEYPNLKPHLGRQLVYIPARCPWGEITEYEVGFFVKRKIKKIFYQTSLNYKPTIEFFKSHDVEGADVDWIPKCFPHFNFIVKNGMKLSAHLHLIPVAITRKCHMARFFGEKNLIQCSKPCVKKAFRMENNALGVELFMDGNVVFRFAKPDKIDVQLLRKLNISELVISMKPLTGVENWQEIDRLINYSMMK